MRCDAARHLMLEADLPELVPAGSTELATHLRECAACRARAERIVAQTRLLAEALRSASSQQDPAAAQRRAATTASRRQSRRRAFRRAALIAPFALAAGIGALVLRGRLGDDPLPQVTPAPPSGWTDLDVVARAGTHVAVFHTDNPQIVVIWYYGAAP